MQNSQPIFHRVSLFNRYQHTMFRFLTIFFVIILALFALELTPPAQTYFVLPWTEALTRVAALLLQSVDHSVAASGKVLTTSRSTFGISVEAGCNGIEALIVLLAALLAFPAPWRHKLAGIVVGALAVQLLNLVRVISLFYIGQWSLPLFEWMHLYAWQALIMLDVLLVWVVWLRTLPRSLQAHVADATS